MESFSWPRVAWWHGGMVCFSFTVSWYPTWDCLGSAGIALYVGGLGFVRFTHVAVARRYALFENEHMLATRIIVAAGLRTVVSEKKSFRVFF